MKYLDEYKNFVSTIEDPLERLDDIEVFIEEYEWSSDRIEESHASGQTSIKEYKSHIKESTVLFKWGDEQVSLLKAQLPDLIDERSKKAWSGHKRLKFPVVWNRESYNKIEPEIRKAGRKGDWIEWLLENLTEGEEEYWTYEDRITNAAQLDLNYYLDFLDWYFSVKYFCSHMSNNFVTFLFNVQKVESLKTGASSKRSRRPKNPNSEKDPNELDKIISRTMKNRIKSNKDLNWHNVLRDLKNNTSENQTITITEIATIHDEMKETILLHEKGLTEATQKLQISTFKKNLTPFRKLLLPK